MAGIEVDGTDEPEQPGDSEGTTTATLSSDEIKTKIAASKCSYGTEVVYDDTIDAVRGGYLYTGRVASLADGARNGGLEF